ncbi:SDR family oxidoreductase [Nocardiopsis sp. NRRL B-16309]|uniref:SDR family oxidoreductase n=1 Tax=Nocardiopsis sp. NRRL B-16309 TaxID=1519494 RepID=UPI0006ADB259|nr:NAD(P)H-binding protein [Nocardiopsis sp. NRRL B-16309]KOX15753.1 nucleoside-diphosphate sugar epimerase [Nocardiopsis sp. NRRL B-16309]
MTDDGPHATAAVKSVLVTGATGTLGRPVTERLRAAGHRVRTLSRHADPDDPRAHAVDLRTGTGLTEALDGADVVVHCASSPTGGDIPAAAHLIRAARRAGIDHLVYISIVGVDRVPLGYYRTKHTVEQALAAGPLGWTVLRTTQFHDLVRALCARMARLPVLPCPDIPLQPIDADEVAARLAQLAQGPPAGRVPDMGGPQVRTLPDLARAYLDARDLERRVRPIRLPGRMMAACREGGLLAPDRTVGSTTFEEFLARRQTESP